MTVDPKKRQKQLAKKTARRKMVQAAKKDSHGGGTIMAAARQLAFAEKFPVHECLMPNEIFEVGIGNVFVTRKLPDGDIGVGVFLVDVFCLGVKNAFFEVMSDGKYAQMLSRFNEHESFARTSPECARKLVESAEAYAAEIGFTPHPDYQWARKIFGDIDAGGCTTEFTFGKDGKPFFVSGPNDTPAKCRQIMNTLFKRLGPDGFHFTTEVEKEDLLRFMREAKGVDLPPMIPAWEETEQQEKEE